MEGVKKSADDAKLVVLALVVNIYGFIKYSSIHEGNMADCSNLSLMIDKLSRRTNAQNPVVVMDAGIATEENLEMIRAKAYHYLCVSRTKLKAHGIHSHWSEIIRIANTQKIITTHGTNKAGETIGVRKCSEPSEKLKNIQSILLMKAKPSANENL